jgi:hypothetical protein
LAGGLLVRGFLVGGLLVRGSLWSVVCHHEEPIL